MADKIALTDSNRQSAAPAHSNIFSEFVGSAYDTGVERPIQAVEQLFGKNVSQPQQEDLHGAMKIAHMAGDAVGSIADFVVLSKVLGKGVGALTDATAGSSEISAFLSKNATAQALTTAGLTGFVSGSLLTPVAQGESQWNRLAQGTVDAGSFVALTGIAGAMAPHMPNSWVGRVGVEAGSGLGAGFVNTNLEALTHGHVASLKDDLSGASSWAIGNVIFGESTHAAGLGAKALGRYAGFDDPVRAIAPVMPNPDTERATFEPAASQDGTAQPQNQELINPRFTPEDPSRPPKVWTILSIDGGGIRGAVPAEVLARLEAKTGMHTTDMFDFITGTSTGGILANGLTLPAEDGVTPKYSAKDMVGLYQKEGPGIFTTNPLRIAKSYIFGGAKYSGVGLDDAMNKYFGDQALFKDQIGRVMVPAVETTTRQPWFFKNWYVNDGQMLTRDIARATSAAPTFFPPLKFDYPLGAHPVENGALIDGGMNANDPASAALAEAVRLSKPGDQFMVVSLGTGKYTQPYTYDQLVKNGPLQWLKPVLSIYADGEPAVTDYAMNQVMNVGPSELHARLANSLGYFRFNTNLTPATEHMDNAAPQNIKDLIAAGDRIVDTEQPDLFNQVAEKLMAIKKAGFSVTPAPDAPVIHEKNPST